MYMIPRRKWPCRVASQWRPISACKGPRPERQADGTSVQLSSHLFSSTRLAWPRFVSLQLGLPPHPASTNVVSLTES